MDEQTANIIQSVIYGAAAFGSIYAITKFSFLKRKSDNDTYKERTKTDMDNDALHLEINRKRLELMATPEYQAYADRRLRALNELRKSTDGKCDNNSRVWPNSSIDDYLNNAVGAPPLAQVE